MKKLFIAFFVLLSAYSFAQTEWAPIGAKWYYSGDDMFIIDSNGAHGYSTYYLYESMADTIISGQPCKVISLTYYDNVTTNWPTEYMFSDSGKVYFYRYNKFNLLYDFNAQAGDTIFVFDRQYSAGNPDTITEIRVDSVNIIVVSSDTLRVQYTTSLNLDSLFLPLQFFSPIIERIGSRRWMFPLSLNENRPYIRCYQDTSLFYRDSFWAVYPCDLLTSINEPDNELFGINVYPNPFSSSTTITLKGVIPSVNEESIQFQLYDVLGRQIYLSHTFGMTNDRGELVIERGSLSNGVYFFRITSPTAILGRGKFVVE